MTTDTHIIDDMPEWMDLSTWHAYDLEGATLESIAAAHFDDPRDKAFLLLRLRAIQARRDFEAANPGRKFPGVFPGGEHADD